VLGLAALPTAAASLLAVAGAFGGLASEASVKGGAAVLFLSGFGAYAALDVMGLLPLRRFYVLAHELTHAAAVWALGGKVFKLVIKAESGHVDLSRMNVFIALAPYWIPLYTLALVGLYRLALWAWDPPYARELFLMLTGASLSFHLLHTVRALWATHQSDLDHAGLPLSMSLIALLNSALILFALKCLFPGSVDLVSRVRWIGSVTGSFWGGVLGLMRRGAALAGPG